MKPNEWLDVLAERIRQRAAACGWTVSGQAGDLAPSTEPLASRSTSPPFRRTLVVDQMPYVILTAFVNAETDDFGEELQHLLWWAANTRQDLDHTRRDDLHMFIIARPTELRRAYWRKLSTAIENNEHFCRKFVWLAPTAPEDAAASAEQLLDRSFLARPWTAAPNTAARALDPLAGILDDPALNKLASTEELAAWVDLLARSDRGGRDVADQLVHVLTPAGGKEP